MASSFKHPACMIDFQPSGWVQNGGRWDLWWNGRSVAHIMAHPVLGIRLCLDARRMSRSKVVAAANVRQAKRYAERWCAVRLCPQLRLRDAVARLVDATPGTQGAGTPPLSREQRQQARRLAEAGAGEVRRIKEALAPRRPPMAVRPDVQENGRAWSTTDQAPPSRPPGGRATPKAPRARSSPLR
ncbi:hypothetical protein N5J01_04550 [Stenotrophomonas sp. GD03701]|uniref:Uncharacterized protein n=1 Tax=Stenotrophomonas maltophilia TaxID=40324 RepID=A0AAW3S1D9_STEMA|nr:MULTISPECIES: hypothetical protein [Stenotrophomonas]MBA0310721.1 hypothetical protein [Stenotrophomonas maltophilia]MDH1387674.1 hypothetical protein [Stenotrophomonas sp. GD03701]MDH1393277.1 hypothetical protein [Stenotrophomonas sp. GD03702]MDQ7301762.1 hypothetical protein [Stenotrophomonas sp. Sm0581]